MNFEGEGVVVAIFLIIRFRGGGKGSLLLVSGDGWGLTSWCRKRGWRRVMRWMVAGWARCQSILLMDSGGLMSRVLEGMPGCLWPSYNKMEVVTRVELSVHSDVTNTVPRSGIVCFVLLLR